MDLTSEQRTIIEAEASDLAVVAGAGSGKTHVLVERYLQLLSGRSIPQIAAITFTEAAAAEMRERVRRAVMSEPSLEQHRELLDEAAIGTVHSLGLRLLREHPVEAGLDPAAAVLPDDEAELLRRAACIEAIDAAAEADDERTTALRGIGVYHAGLRLPRMVAQRDAVEAAFAAMGADSAGWPARVRAILDAHYGPRQTSIREQAQAIAARIRRDAVAGEPDMVAPTEFAAAGPPPTVVSFESDDSEAALVVEQAENAAMSGSVGILLRRNADVPMFANRLPRAQRVDRDLVTWNADPGVSIGTVHGRERARIRHCHHARSHDRVLA